MNINQHILDKGLSSPPSLTSCLDINSQFMKGCGKKSDFKSFANLVFIVIIGHSWYHVRTIPLNFHVDIFIRSVSGMGVKKEVLGGCWGFLTGDSEDMVIPDVKDDLILPKGKYSESFM